MRGTRDLLRRRTFLVRRRGELLAHVQNTFTQHNLPTTGSRGRDLLRQDDPAAAFTDESIQWMLRSEIEVIGQLDETIVKLEAHVIRPASARSWRW